MRLGRIYILRSCRLFIAIVLVLSLSLPVLYNNIVKAGLPTSRKITISSSAGSATDVTYTLQFTTDQGGAASNIGGMVVDFCDLSPIIGEGNPTNCTAPTGFDINKATLVLGTQVGITGFAVDTVNSSASKLVLTRSVTSIATGTAVTIPIGGAGASDGVTNPTAGNHTFYARVLTYALGATAVAYTSLVPGTYVDGGGIALSTANQIQITARVQERLTFCIYLGATCTADTSGAARTSSIALGNTNGVLDPGGPFVDRNAKFDVSTNAVSGATVVMRGDTLKSGGSLSITAIGATAASSTAGSEQFGMCLYQSSGSGLTLPNATYSNANCSTTTQSSGTGTTGGAGSAQFGFNTTNTAGANGDTIATKAAGATAQATLAFIGNIAYITEAGVYQSTLTYVATGQY